MKNIAASQKLKVFYTHAIVYISVNMFVMIINLLLTPGRLWFQWLLLSWGMVLVWHRVMARQITKVESEK